LNDRIGTYVFKGYCLRRRNQDWKRFWNINSVKSCSTVFCSEKTDSNSILGCRVYGIERERIRVSVFIGDADRLARSGSVYLSVIIYPLVNVSVLTSTSGDAGSVHCCD